jgi:4-amino-4-deoxy-L-arabinose transferase-like glycosyltransferase
MVPKIIQSPLASTEHADISTHDLLSRLSKWVLQGAKWERIALVILIVVAPFLLFYNLQYNPRPWHDEGTALSLSKTLAMDGIYAVRSLDDYQTYGAAQSVGPTVLMPIAWSFRLFGIGLVQGRLVTASYALLTLALFYRCGLQLFGRRAALLAVVFLLASQAVGYFMYGRPVLGEVPALGFFLGGWLAWSRSVRHEQKWLDWIAGLLIGAAMVTKSQYIVLGTGTLVLLAVLDRFFYRQGRFKSIVLVGIVSLACVAAWFGWQVAYFGLDTFARNLANIRQLAKSASNFSLHWGIEALKFLFGSGSGYFYFFWGIPALIYVGFSCIRRSKESLVLAFLFLFTCLWLCYYTLGTIPWPRYALPALAISALFVGKLYHDLAHGLIHSLRDTWTELRQSSSSSLNLTPSTMMSLGTFVALITMALLTGYQLQRTIRMDVLDTVGQENAFVLTPPQLRSPYKLAAFLNEEIDKQSVIETWDQELDVLTDHRYHFPDQSLLVRTHAATYQGASRDYVLGSDYFNAVRPSYVVVGWYARYIQVYDPQFLREHGALLATIGDGEWRYDVYKLSLASSVP